MELWWHNKGWTADDLEGQLKELSKAGRQQVRLLDLSQNNLTAMLCQQETSPRRE